MQNVMATPSNISGPYVQCRKLWLTPTTRVLGSNAAKMRNLLKLAGVPQTIQPISVTTGSKFTILWGHVGEILPFNKFFPIVDTCLSCEDRARQSCATVRRWQIFGDFFASCIFSEPRAASFRSAS